MDSKRGSKRRKSTNRKGQGSKGEIHLPVEIIADILCRLSIESILTCRVVCKTWRNVTRDSCFINKLGNSLYQPPRLILKPLMENISDDAPRHLILLDIEERKTRRIPFDRMLADLEIMCSCDGLLCIASSRTLNPVIIYNPITREQFNVAKIAFERLLYLIMRLVLALIPQPKSTKFSEHTLPLLLRVKSIILTSFLLEKDQWRKLTEPGNMVKRDVYGVVSWGGALYWRIVKGPFIVIVQFNLSDEKFRMFNFPDYFPRNRFSLGLIDVGGSLTLVQNANNVVELWKLTENKVNDLSLSLQDTHNMHVRWGGGLFCEFVCQMNQKSYLVQVGLRNCQRQQQEHLTLYFPETSQYSTLEILGLPKSFMPIWLKPNLMSLT
ncbi:hypothetical protein HYC85_029931 [Camellia sinensis]|uniref:F-box domain-containing protein n=1 Tax=Camellia sinensis TaxID=4442 RepID=A0A7J7FZ98_CAMSI|nr:hypothetical protein HYC85_029931 [Camellia sinensis]